MDTIISSDIVCSLIFALGVLAGIVIDMAVLRKRRERRSNAKR